MYRFLVTILLLAISNFTFSQPDSVRIGIDGLTCSMCSYSVQSMIKGVPEVVDVKMDLNANEATVTLRPGSSPDLALLVKKVYDAGFSVRSVFVYLNVQDIEWQQSALRYGSYIFQVPPGKAPDLNVLALKLVDENFFSKKRFKKFSKNRHEDGDTLLHYKAVFAD